MFTDRLEVLAKFVEQHKTCLEELYQFSPRLDVVLELPKTILLAKALHEAKFPPQSFTSLKETLRQSLIDCLIINIPQLSRFLVFSHVQQYEYFAKYMMGKISDSFSYTPHQIIFPNNRQKIVMFIHGHTEFHLQKVIEFCENRLGVEALVSGPNSSKMITLQTTAENADNVYKIIEMIKKKFFEEHKNLLGTFDILSPKYLRTERDDIDSILYPISVDNEDDIIPALKDVCRISTTTHVIPGGNLITNRGNSKNNSTDMTHGLNRYRRANKWIDKNPISDRIRCISYRKRYEEDLSGGDFINDSEFCKSIEQRGYVRKSHPDRFNSLSLPGSYDSLYWYKIDPIIC